MARATDPGTLLADVLCAGGAQGRAWLVAGDGGAVAETLANLGQDVAAWHRHATTGPPTEAPPPGPFDAVALRMPRGRAGLGLAVELCAARTVPGGRLWAYGTNDEGARSAARHLEPWFTDIETVDARRHARLWTARRSDAPARAEIATHATRTDVPLFSGARTFVAYPGVFAGGALDPATALLLAHLPAARPSTVLDFACGIGILAAEARARWPDAAVMGLDADALAVRAARENVPGGTFACGAGWSALAALPLPRHGADLILSNPPLHAGHHIDLRVLDDLVRGARLALAPGGLLALVTQRQRPPFGRKPTPPGAHVVADDGRFAAWHIPATALQ